MRTLLHLAVAIVFSATPAAPVRAQTQTADQTIAAARLALQQHRQAEAVTLFERAMAQDPARRVAVLNDYAESLAESGKPARAIAAYRELLQVPTISPAERDRARSGLVEARLAYAGSLWDDGRLAEAAVQYRLVVADDAQNAEALRNLARLASVDGRQHQAKQMATAYLAGHPNDIDSRLTLAQAEYWMGRPDSAQGQLQLVLAREPKNGDALSLRSDIRASQAPEFRTKFDVAKQSDDILVQGTHFEGESTLSGGRSSLGFYFDHYRYTARNETGELLVNRPALYGRYRINDWMELAGELSSDRILSPQDSSFNQTIGTYDADLAIWTNDTTRFDLRSQRQTLDNVVSLGLGIAEQIHSLSMEVRPDHVTRGYLSLGRAAYNDGNRATIEQAEYERQVSARPHIYVGVRGYAANYDRQLDDGYFSPNAFRALEATARLESPGDRLWGYDVHGSYGREWIASATGDTASVLGAALRYRLSRATQLELFYDAENTVQASNSGSFRHSAGIAFRQRL